MDGNIHIDIRYSSKSTCLHDTVYDKKYTSRDTNINIEQ